MTELEKKADKYAYEVYSTRPLGDDPTDDEIKEAYIQGYKDAMAWHYPSKGELPEKDGEYFITVKIEGGGFLNALALYYVDRGWLGMFNKPYAWQYIIPPKEEV